MAREGGGTDRGIDSAGGAALRLRLVNYGRPRRRFIRAFLGISVLAGARRGRVSVPFPRSAVRCGAVRVKKFSMGTWAVV